LKSNKWLICRIICLRVCGTTQCGEQRGGGDYNTAIAASGAETLIEKLGSSAVLVSLLLLPPPPPPPQAKPDNFPWQPSNAIIKFSPRINTYTGALSFSLQIFPQRAIKGGGEGGGEGPNIKFCLSNR
jgi:hypothetical protein